MKTADLIPFILLELNESDKYGFELTKAIETKSNGQIIIKQPTLYTLLKKLEKSKFITSYWEDSEIGGKRHYYKLTQNGRLQVSTLPSYDFLMKNLLNEETAEDYVSEQTNETETANSVKTTSIMDELLNSTPSPAETPLPTEEVFAETNLDNSTELELNVANTEILKENSTAIDEQFANSENVSKFTEKVAESTVSIVPEETKTAKSDSILDFNYTTPKNETEVKFVDYVNFKNTESYKYSKAISSKILLQSLSTSACLFVVALICSLITSFTGRSVLYYIFFITSIFIILFYPIIIAINKDKIRLKYQSVQYNSKTKLRLYIGLTFFLLISICCIVINMKIENNTINSILSFNNFENFYAPLLMSAVYFFDLLFNHLFMAKLKK